MKRKSLFAAAAILLAALILLLLSVTHNPRTQTPKGDGWTLIVDQPKAPAATPTNTGAR